LREDLRTLIINLVTSVTMVAVHSNRY